MQQDIMFQILISLLKQRRVTREYLGERFELSKRTISRYISVLIDSGIPIKTMHGTGGGYAIADDYLLHYLFFTEYELNKLKMLLDNSADKQSQILKDKLEAAHTTRATNEYIIKQENLLIDAGNITNPEFFQDKIQLLNKAIDSCRTLDLMYVDARQSISYREIDPYTLILKNGVWYIYAFCHLRKSFRTFKLSRIRSSNLTTKNFIKTETELLKQLEQKYYDQLFIDLEFEFSSLALAKVQEWLGLDAISERGTIFVARAQVPSNEALFEKLLSLGSYIKIITPAALQEEILVEAQRILNKYE